MPPKPHAGLLPLYLELYDERLPQMRRTLEPFLEQVGTRLKNQGIEVTTAPVCRTPAEVAAAVGSLESAEVDALVTLHLAYSPSLHSAEVLARSKLPLILCDTTLDYDFGPTVDCARILYNHGIHGVQDLASVLRRLGKNYTLAAGHVTQSQVLSRTAHLVRAAHGAHRLRTTRALRVGESFAGMGDFAVRESTLQKTLGIRVDQISVEKLGVFAQRVTPAQIDAEMARDCSRYEVAVAADVHRRSVRVSLALRACLEEGRYDAFSMNFAAFTSPDEPLDTVPFLEASKAMARGIGYAGEGDVLTAALVGALAQSWGNTTFTEIFCPDWKGGSLFLSHMGEINPQLSATKPLLCEKPFPFTGARNPAILTGTPRPGPAVLVNLAPGPRDTFDLLLAPVEVLEDSTHPSMQEQIRAWVRPNLPLAEFLEAYSQHGGTHHSALVLGSPVEALQAFGRFSGLKSQVL